MTPISLPTSLTSFGGLAVSPTGNAAVVFGNASSGSVGFNLDTSVNQISGLFPVPAGSLSSAAFAPSGNAIWFLSGISPSVTLTQESFPAGQVITESPAQGTSILFGPAL